MKWVLVGHWKGDPDIWVQQVYGPFKTKKAALKWKRSEMDKSWHCEAFRLLDPIED